MQYPTSYESLCLFPLFKDASDYRERIGIEPPWTPTNPVKYWFDPNAAKSTKRTIVYPTCITGLIIDGQPEVDAAVYPRDRAASVNIPPSNWNGSIIPAEPLPIRDLLPIEELYADSNGNILVRDKTMTLIDVATMVKNINDLLKRISNKLGVT
jgi:hypothetical protein